MSENEHFYPVHTFPPPRLRIDVEYRPSNQGQAVEPSQIVVEVNHDSIDFQLVAGVLDLLRGDAARPEPSPDPRETSGTWPLQTTYGNTAATTVFPAINDHYDPRAMHAAADVQEMPR